MVKIYKRGILTVSLFSAFTSHAGTNAQSKHYDTTGKFAGTYLCVMTASGGVRYSSDSKKWTGTTFRIEDQNLIVQIETSRPVREYESRLTNQSKFERVPVTVQGYDVRIGSVGKETQRCSPMPRREAVVSSKRGFIDCQSFLVDYRFNIGKLRIMEIYKHGFLDGADNNKNTPAITVGKCSRIK